MVSNVLYVGNNNGIVSKIGDMGKVGKVSKIGDMGKVCKAGNMGKVGKVSKNW